VATLQNAKFGFVRFIAKVMINLSANVSIISVMLELSYVFSMLSRDV